ncbi:hypothetical protein CONPUDRAFT_161643 [Coniophora puteana RWD-64-598 SS2]|uniref:Homeobox domain-containing protein n=1 Tax=Coniophora puteana (strain RWD-64-598) TaxID=741705 RepID=A0A5M3N6T6_CONPW|nr:uncharacterized protein CONPUDRAFT_161643 [Coniophora puteana RWD-64-598 SS2]EIW87026.1 hypothetical protein CONPUDRAFT_161643 [Coniophora puteana RWD-64-598 SS2]
MALSLPSPPFPALSSSPDMHQSSMADAYVPYIRRRVSPAQLNALQHLFEIKSHPTRQERNMLASEIGMDIKAVTTWFQNRRSAVKRRSHAWKENVPFTDARSQKHAHRFDSKASRSSRIRSSASLDQVAALSERPQPPSIAPSGTIASPVTPKKRRVGPAADKQLWEYMQSSPSGPQLSPSVEEARMSILLSRSKTRRSLEWACFKARRGSKANSEDPDEDDETASLPSLTHHDTDREDAESDDELLTPETSINLSLAGDFQPMDSELSMIPNKKATLVDRQSEDIEAAMVLLGFIGRH